MITVHLAERRPEPSALLRAPGIAGELMYAAERIDELLGEQPAPYFAPADARPALVYALQTIAAVIARIDAAAALAPVNDD